jgi:hypothetical protein
MAKITMAAPFDTRGRYRGGICALVGAVIHHSDRTALFGAEVPPSRPVASIGTKADPVNLSRGER